MPLILPKEKEQDWLNSKLDGKVIKGIMQPYDANDMVAHPVKNKLSRLGYNTVDETITAKFDYPGLPGLV